MLANVSRAPSESTPLLAPNTPSIRPQGYNEESKVQGLRRLRRSSIASSGSSSTGCGARVAQLWRYLTAWFNPAEAQSSDPQSPSLTSTESESRKAERETSSTSSSDSCGCYSCCCDGLGSFICMCCNSLCCGLCEMCEPRASSPPAQSQYPMTVRRSRQGTEGTRSERLESQGLVATKPQSTAAVHTPALHVNPTKLDKLCAGICFYCDGEVLLLLRNSVRNDCTWDFPGGQIDGEDFDERPQQSSSNSLNEAMHASARTSNDIVPLPLYEQNRKLTNRHYTFGVNSPTWRAALREAAEELGALPSPIEVISAHNLYRTFDTKRYTLYLCKIPPRAKIRFQPPLSEEHVAWGWFPLLAIPKLVRMPNIPELPHGRFELHPWVECFLEQHIEIVNRLSRPKKWIQTSHCADDFYNRIASRILAAASAAKAERALD